MQAYRRSRRIATIATLFGFLTICPNVDLNFVRNLCKSPTQYSSTGRYYFSCAEENTLKEVLALIKDRYKFDIDPIFIKTEPRKYLSDISDMCFPRLGRSDDLYDGISKRFIDAMGRDIYIFLEGRDVITLSGVDYKSEDIPNPYCAPFTNLEDFRLTATHEIAHVIFDRIQTPELVDSFVGIDIENKISEICPSTNHPGHLSLSSYFYVCSLDSSREMRFSSANEQFADILSFYVLGYIPKILPDKHLQQKIDIVKKALKPYER
jgi:hypothetical protein